MKTIQMISERTELKFELLNKTILAITEARKQGSKQLVKMEDKIESLFIGTIGMSYDVARQYIDEAKKRI